MRDCILKLENANKHFPGVYALKDVHYDLKKGEVHALLGENGAGKSTLIKVLAGVHKLDSGLIIIEGKKIDLNNYNIDTAKNIGISVIYQEIALAENMTVAENIFLGQEPVKGFIKMLDTKKEHFKALESLKEMGTDILPDTIVSMLSIAQKQIIEIIKALSVNAKIIIMDEPTASLSETEVSKLFEVIKNLKKQGISIIYITHRIDELFEIADRVTILRDGSYITTKNIKDCTSDELVKLMVGRDITNYYECDRKLISTGKTALEVRDLTSPPKVRNVSLYVEKGEIVGISGLVGSGRTELAHVLFGIDHPKSGQILINGEECKLRSPQDAIRRGIVLVPENRKEHGLILIQNVGFNLTLCVLKEFLRKMHVYTLKEQKIINEYIEKLSIKVSSHEQLALNLSGGNQQKVVFGKWLASKPKILILDEPTRGIDIGVKAEIYSIMARLAEQGVSILMISSEMAEIINMCDRTYVMHEGETKACFNKNEVSQELIMSVACQEVVKNESAKDK